MKENSFIYLRGLKHAAFTVFCVEDGQKSYYDPQFNVRVPFQVVNRLSVLSWSSLTMF